ncbi:HEPN domain-containing protein [candidate division KSB1 bacterium]|nr:HEPN domain-containing protein [candidate division KSB1 bacterium]
MTKEEHIQYWQDSADHDLESAETILQSGKYDWALFIGHLALEKVLKAVFVAKNENKIPPKLHNLVRLAELSNIELDEKQRFDLDKINDFNIQTRYPDYKFEFYKRCDQKFANKQLEIIKDYFIWFKSLTK